MTKRELKLRDNNVCPWILSRGLKADGREKGRSEVDIEEGEREKKREENTEAAARPWDGERKNCAIHGRVSGVCGAEASLLHPTS